MGMRSIRVNFTAFVVTVLMLVCGGVVLSGQPAAQAASSANAKADESAKKPLSPREQAAEEKRLRRQAERAAKEAADKKTAELSARPPFRDSLLFTDLEIDTILKAEAGRAVQSTVGIEAVELIPVDRKIWVSGIYYKNPRDWILWMNGYKLTPGYLLPEIRGIKVEQDRVHLEWYDIGKNGIINITMQPHQVYDIVTGILVWDTDGGAPAFSGKASRSRGGRR